MLSLACAAVFAHASIQFEIPVRFLRPSRIVAMIQGAEGRPALLPDPSVVQADDANWIVRVKGSADEVTQVRYFVKLVDVLKPTMQLKIHVDSPADRFGYDLTTSLRSGQKWRMSEDATGTNVVLSPRLNDDNTCTFFCKVEGAGSKWSTTFRLKEGQVLPFVLGSAIKREVRTDGTKITEKLESVPLPSLTFSYHLEKAKPYVRSKV